MLYVSQQCHEFCWATVSYVIVFFRLERVWKQWAGLGHSVEVKRWRRRRKRSMKNRELNEKKGWVLMNNVLKWVKVTSRWSVQDCVFSKNNSYPSCSLTIKYDILGFISKIDSHHNTESTPLSCVNHILGQPIAGIWGCGYCRQAEPEGVHLVWEHEKYLYESTLNTKSLWKHTKTDNEEIYWECFVKWWNLM